MIESLRILSFDPGLTIAGWAVCDYKVKTGKLIVVRCGTIMPARVADSAAMREPCAIYGRRLIALSTARQMVSELYEEYKPDLICCEDAFFNSFRPSAFAALMQWIMTVELFLKDKHSKALFKMAPKSIKHTIFKGTASKVDVCSAVVNHPDISFKQPKRPNELIEHESDAIAIAYTFTVNILPSLLSSISKDEHGTTE